MGRSQEQGKSICLGLFQDRFLYLRGRQGFHRQCPNNKRVPKLNVAWSQRVGGSRQRRQAR